MHSVSNRIKQFNQDLLPNMVALKYEAMIENAFRFFRGTCHLYYQDLAQANTLPKSPLTWVCGDLHIENYGSYKGENRLVYFDLNDFDEGLLAPASWEISRMLTSILVAFEALKIGEEEALRMVALFLKTYSATLSSGKTISIEPRTAKGIVCSFLEKEANRKIQELLDKRTTTTKKGKIILSLDHKRHFAIPKALKIQLMDHITHWISNSSDGPYNYKVLDAVFRLAGTGSVGVKRYMFLLRSKDKTKYLLLDMKQATTSSVQPYVTVEQPVWGSEAERVLVIQQRMQNVLPALLSVIDFKGDSYMLQEMQPTEDKIDFGVIKKRYRDIYQVIDDMASLAASAQLRSAGRQGSATADDLIAFGSDNEWHEKLISYAQHYAKQVKKDYKDFKSDYKKGVFKFAE
jgi:uncharacterized protein (DUF2252 family)